MEAVVKTELTWTIIQTTSRRHAYRTAVEVVGPTASDVASVLGNDVDMVEQRRETSVDELRRHWHVAKQQT